MRREGAARNRVEEIAAAGGQIDPRDLQEQKVLEWLGHIAEAVDHFSPKAEEQHRRCQHQRERREAVDPRKYCEFVHRREGERQQNADDGRLRAMIRIKGLDDLPLVVTESTAHAGLRRLAGRAAIVRSRPR